MNKPKTIADLHIQIKFDCGGKTRKRFTFDDHLMWDNDHPDNLNWKIKKMADEK